MEAVVALIDEVLRQPENESVQRQVGEKVKAMMAHRPLFTY
jgi:glycine/serine hydroxymethyltransferase